ncbi:hypothetical protein EOM60_01125 [Candidatus Saccharibacteria bacterium]|nr:hypothetical protein [Candidatus Saccharibacteria bacterium]
MKNTTATPPTEIGSATGLCGYYSTGDEFQPEISGSRIADSRILDTAISQDSLDVPTFGPDLDTWVTRKQQRELAQEALKLCTDCPVPKMCQGARTLENMVSGENSPYENERYAILRGIARVLTTKVPGTVLKGGLALRLYGLPRDTDDIDLDMYTKAGLLAGDKKKIQKLIEQQLGGSGTPKKDTPTTLRYTTVYKKAESTGLYPIKVEYKFINSSLSESHNAPSLNSRDGIMVYSLEEILSQKFGAATTRSKARDLFDISWILSQDPSTIKGISTPSLSSLLVLLRPTLSKASIAVPAELVNWFATDPNIPHWVNLEAGSSMLNQLADTINLEIYRREQPKTNHLGVRDDVA